MTVSSDSKQQALKSEPITTKHFKKTAGARLIQCKNEASSTCPKKYNRKMKDAATNIFRRENLY